MQVFKGHMPFGIHKRLPQDYTYITFLRDPIERVVSAYYFARNYPGASPASVGKQIDAGGVCVTVAEPQRPM